MVVVPSKGFFRVDHLGTAVQTYGANMRTVVPPVTLRGPQFEHAFSQHQKPVPTAAAHPGRSVYTFELTRVRQSVFGGLQHHADITYVHSHERTLVGR